MPEKFLKFYPFGEWIFSFIRKITSMKGITAALFIALSCMNDKHTCTAQTQLTENIVIITIDGLRWQELFQGADYSIAFNSRYVSDEDLVKRFWEQSAVERREALMPFMWKVMANRGQLYGNRNYGNKVDCTNRSLVSYPGYSEMLIGFRDPRVRSNRRVEDAHPTVLEVISRNFRFSDEVAAFATWGAFNFILREDHSDIHVNAGRDLAEGDISPREESLNELLLDGDRRTDSITFQYAMEYFKRVRPRVTFIGLDGTDHHAHAGRYDKYLNAAHQADKMISHLWNWLQSQPDYKDRTTLFITTDHGRGNGRNNWRKHGILAAGSRHIWFAVMGPDTPAFGEMKVESLMYQKQSAQTIAAFLGLPYESDEPVGDVLQTMIAIPAEETVLSAFGE